MTEVAGGQAYQDVVRRRAMNAMCSSGRIVNCFKAILHALTFHTPLVCCPHPPIRCPVDSKLSTGRLLIRS